jgi:hypothetical protein
MEGGSVYSPQTPGAKQNEIPVNTVVFNSDKINGKH